MIIDKQISVCPTLGDDNVAASASSSATTTAYYDCVWPDDDIAMCLLRSAATKATATALGFGFGLSLFHIMYFFFFFIIVRQNILWAMKSVVVVDVVVMPLRDELRVLPNSFFCKCTIMGTSSNDSQIFLCFWLLSITSKHINNKKIANRIEATSMAAISFGSFEAKLVHF